MGNLLCINYCLETEEQLGIPSPHESNEMISLKRLNIKSKAVVINSEDLKISRRIIVDLEELEETTIILSPILSPLSKIIKNDENEDTRSITPFNLSDSFEIIN